MNGEDFEDMAEETLQENIANLEFVISKTPEGAFRKALQDQLTRLGLIFKTRRASKG